MRSSARDFPSTLCASRNHSLPPPLFLHWQHEWLSAARARLLRKARIAHRRRVLDLGCGYGLTSEELRRRCAGEVIALDRSFEAVSWPISTPRVCGDAARLPFADRVFDLVFADHVLMWVNDLCQVLQEVYRVLVGNGALVALEPDFGGMMEWPEEGASRDTWIAALSRAGADPMVGRKLPGLLRATGFNVHVGLLDTLMADDQRRWDLLLDLPLTTEEREEAHRRKEQLMSVVHLPHFLIFAFRKL